MIDTSNIIYGGFSSVDEWLKEWEPDPKWELELLVLVDREEPYEADAWMLLRDAFGVLYEVSGSHCSCYGFEGQFEPQVTTKAYLLSDKFDHSIRSDSDAMAAIRQALGEP